MSKEKLSESGMLLAKVHRFLERRFSEKLRRFGLDEINPAQGRVLFVLWQEDRLPVTELAKRTSLGKSTLTSMLDRLEQAGYVRRTPSPDDRRVVTVERTQKDETFRRSFLDLSAEMTEEWRRGFTPEERAQFEQYLKRILANLEDGDSKRK